RPAAALRGLPRSSPRPPAAHEPGRRRGAADRLRALRVSASAAIGAASRASHAPARHLGDFDLAVVGSGCAGSVLARAVRNAGRRVLLVERGVHPRFALGESSTPLAALALERLAARWRMPDLRDLAAYGRWLARRPHLRRGLKRGFT